MQTGRMCDYPRTEAIQLNIITGVDPITVAPKEPQTFLTGRSVP